MSRETALIPNCEQDDPIKDMRIIVCRHKNERDWSIAIGGKLYAHISTNDLEALIESEVIVTETSLTSGMHRARFGRPHPATNESLLGGESARQH